MTIEVIITNTYFLIFQPEDVLNLCLNFTESQPTYVYKRDLIRVNIHPQTI